ncbi:MAG TPA: efflux RND transporter periplasmic adaptor subunit [Sulfuricurvum sp.]|nr:efflux RND transporter periplasmic adaptor subunit [Sulfuricurvum sp.]
MTFVNSKRWLIGGAVLIGVGVLAYNKIYLPKNAQVTPSAPVKVEFSVVSGVGTIEAKEIVVLAPKTTSKLQALFADEGDRIGQGQVLAKMEISELRGNLQESSANIAKSKAQMASQEAIIEDLKAKKNLADINLNRYVTLLKGGFVTQAEFDSAQALSQSATAQLMSAKENLKLSQHDIQRSQAALLTQQDKIDDLSLRSPFDGVVVSRNFEVGSTVGAGMAVFHIANPKTLWIKTYIDERQSGRLQVGQSATVTLRSFSNQKFTGKVARIGVESDRITEERVVYVTLDTIPDPIHIGEQAEAIIDISSPKKL